MKTPTLQNGNFLYFFSDLSQFKNVKPIRLSCRKNKQALKTKFPLHFVCDVEYYQKIPVSFISPSKTIQLSVK
jgi:hypothetical protein